MNFSKEKSGQIRHFSFDLWLTLIKSNPDFKKQRAYYFYNNLNTLKKPISEVENIFREVDIMCNEINQQTGKNLSSEEMYLMVIFKMNNSLTQYLNLDMNLLYAEIQKLVFNYMPLILDVKIYSCLDKIKEANKTLNILSNTAFIKGSTLRIINENLGLTKYFDFQIYSDEVGFSKPNINIFNILLENIFRIQQNEHISKREILHIGDNEIADISGANLAGINAFKISNSNDLISLFN